MGKLIMDHCIDMGIYDMVINIINNLYINNINNI